MQQKKNNKTTKETTQENTSAGSPLQTELAQTKEQLVNASENFLRLQAEFANFKKRAEESQARSYAQARCDVLREFVKVFDDFELALRNTTKENPQEFKKGIEMIFAKFISTAEEMGLERIKTVGEQFNPQEHEALLAQESDKPEHTILEELQSGYKVRDAVIRTAKVKVAKQK
jgi:molecular chaperone GrpE